LNRTTQGTVLFRGDGSFSPDKEEKLTVFFFPNNGEDEN